MLLEKLKQHGGKIMFFMMNILVVTSGVLFIKQKDAEKTAANNSQIDAQNFKSATDYAYDAQQRIMADQNAKLGSVANNTGTINKDKVVPVTKTIPAVTKTVTVQQSAPSSASNSASAAPSVASSPVSTKATTKKS